MVEGVHTNPYQDRQISRIRRGVNIEVETVLIPKTRIEAVCLRHAKSASLGTQGGLFYCWGDNRTLLERRLGSLPSPIASWRCSVADTIEGMMVSIEGSALMG